MATCVSCSREVPEGSIMCESCQNTAVEAGSWRDVSVTEAPPLVQAETVSKLETKSYPDLVETYSLFKEFLGVNPKVVYHPCSASDISPTVAFPDSRVIFAEKDKNAVAALRDRGLEVYEGDVNKFQLPKKADVVILLNPQVESVGPVADLKEFGYVLCNDYHGTATELRKNEDFELVGIITNNNEEGTKVFDTTDLDSYWQPIDSDTELEKKSSYRFQVAKKIVQSYLNTDKDIVKNYHQLFTQFYDKNIGASYDPVTRTVFLPLPRKKGDGSNFYAYRRIQNFENRPGWLKKYETGRGVINIDGQQYSFTVCSKEMPAPMRYFIGYFEKRHLFISEEVPESDREYCLAHEIREFTDPEFVGKPGRCAKGVERELTEVPSERRQAYIERRIKMFEGLVDHWSNLVNNEKDKDKKSQHQEMLTEVSGSLSYLISLNKID